VKDSSTRTSRPLWVPSTERREAATLTRYMRWLRDERKLSFVDYEVLWRWSVDDLEGFWDSVWSFFDVPQSHAHSRVLQSDRMPGAQWFPGARLNYVDQLLRHSNREAPAVIFESETIGEGSVSWADLEAQAGGLAAELRRLGVQQGDRVAAYLPNVPQAVVAFLATASLGAVWSICAPDMGASSVIDRFAQISPKVLIACDGYRYGGKRFDRKDVVSSILEKLPTVSSVIHVPLLDPPAEAPAWIAGRTLIEYQRAVATPAPLLTEQVPFDHPLWIVYSSGTTGLPKGIVHGHGGVLAIGLTMAGLHWDLKPRDRFFWFASTGWIMWNLQVMGLLTGSTICLFDGAVTGPAANADWLTLWKFVERHEVKLFGAGAAYFAACLKAGITPVDSLRLQRLETVGSTGSPLSPECYDWIYSKVKRNVWLLGISGGTDIAGSFLTGTPTLPVYAGEMQCRNLGAAVYSFDDSGKPVLDQVGELVCTRPMPSMPLYFWNDGDNQRYLESYFNTYTGAGGERIWRHADWLELTVRSDAVGGVIYGRSDATVNRQGIRMGTSELYRVVEAHPDVLDSLVIDLEYLGRPSYLGLFVVLAPERELTLELSQELKERLRRSVSPRMVPDEVLRVGAIPRTLTGKKLEVPLKKLMLGQSADSVINRDTLSNPDSVEWFVAFAAQRAT
jgi:acetoacetyl-CoA synthetase